MRFVRSDSINPVGYVMSGSGRFGHSWSSIMHIDSSRWYADNIMFQDKDVILSYKNYFFQGLPLRCLVR